jgi:tRNA 2-thiocytidine biosynthesis protein TtcA
VDKGDVSVVSGKKQTKLFLHLKKWLEKAVLDYNMIEEGDRVLVGVSGGADSLALLDLLNTPMVYVPPFSLIAVNIDPGFDPTYTDYDKLEKYLRENSIDHYMEKTDIGPLSHSDYNKKNPCFLCSRLRRKRIFEVAAERGCTKIAFAHHKDDIIETLLINLFFGREISTMMPQQTIFQGRLHIIRPFAYIGEDLIKKYVKEQRLPSAKNKCPTSNTSRRIYIKKLLKKMERDNKNVRNNIYKALRHIRSDYLPQDMRDMK